MKMTRIRGGKLLFSSFRMYGKRNTPPMSFNSLFDAAVLASHLFPLSAFFVILKIGIGAVN